MRNRGFAIGITILWCMVYINIFKSLALGISMGIMLGMAFGLFDAGDSGGVNGS